MVWLSSSNSIQSTPPVSTGGKNSEGIAVPLAFGNSSRDWRPLVCETKRFPLGSITREVGEVLHDVLVPKRDGPVALLPKNSTLPWDSLLLFATAFAS